MSRNLSVSESEIKSVTSRASELSVLNDDECKRILAVLERDFKLRQKEFQRLNEIKKTIQQETHAAEYLSISKEFNLERCIRCCNPFRIFFNPKETCLECKLFVCQKCAIYTKDTKVWTCKSCLQLKELEVLSSDWFYEKSSKKHKRCGSAKVVRELHKREKELADLDELDDDLGYATLPTSSVISYVPYDKNVKRELKEYSLRLTFLVERLQADLAERNTANKQRSVRGKSKEGLKSHQEQIATEIGRARVAISGPLRRSNEETNTTHERDLHNLLIQQTEEVLRTNLEQFQKTLTAPKSSINSSNFDQKLSQTIFDKCVSKEIFQELPQVVDSSSTGTSELPPTKPQRQSSNTSSLTSLTKPSTSGQPTWSNSSPHTSSASWEIQSRHDNIQRVSVPKNSTVDEEEDTEKEEEDDDEEEKVLRRKKSQPVTTTESIQFDNGLKLDLSSIDDGDDETSVQNNHRRSIDSDFEAMQRSRTRVGDWQTNFTLVESKSSSHSGEETPRSIRESLFLTIPATNGRDLSPRVGDKPLEDLADDDLYADGESSTYPLPVNTTTLNEQSQISDNESVSNRKLFPLPANLLLQNHSSCSFRRPSYQYESDNESITSSIPCIAEMKTLIDEEKFRMDPNITDPKFILRPKDVTIRTGETAKFKTHVTGSGPIDVFWFRYGTDEELVNDEKYQLSHDETYHYLKIYSTTKEDEGAYLCVIANDRAQNVDMVKLSVKDNKRSFDPPKILEEFVDTDVQEGSSLQFQCKLDRGYPKARVLWYKETSLIKPDGHYKLHYYGDGQHGLHVDHATIEDDNGTFTCLALNASGRVQITADVFVHEKEVIDIPRNSPSMKNTRRKCNEQNIPVIPPSISPLVRNPHSEDEEEQSAAKRFMDKFKNERSNKLLEDWQNLYETSVHSLQSDDEESRSQPQPKPFFLNQPASLREPLVEGPRSPVLTSERDLSPTKSKWEIRLPQLLNGPVGPDRQKRDLSRRHTTNISFQPTSTFFPSDKEFNPLSQSYSSSEMPNPTEGDRPPSPLVKQLKQKFDRMSVQLQTNEQNKSRSPSQNGSAKVSRVGTKEEDGAYPLLPVASLTCRGLTSNSGERSIQKPRPMLPISLSPERKLTHSESFNPNDRQQRGKTSPPISYINHFSSPSRSITANVVKQLIGGGATLVYDSLSQTATSHTTPLLQHRYYPNHHYQQQRKEHVRVEQTAHHAKTKLTTNPNLLITCTDRQTRSTSSSNAKRRATNVNSDNEKSNSSQCLMLTRDSLNRSTTMSDNLFNSAKSSESSSESSFRSITPLERKSVLARAELWDRRISTNENDTTYQPTTYDIEQWSTEFEKIQNPN